MGREKKILLGLLGLLAGVFFGVLSLKLLVPRPPAGTGPDVLPEAALATAQDRVEPPAPTPGGWDFAGAPPLVPDPPVAPADVAEPMPPVAAFAAEVPGDEPRGGSRFTAAAPPPVEPPAPSAHPPTADAAVEPASWRTTVEPPPAAAFPLPAPPQPSRAAAPVAGAYLVAAGDSWWAVAERAYGDGRLYRALFAWNRARDPRVSLAPGTRLDVPPLASLQAAWPRLLPRTAPR